MDQLVGQSRQSSYHNQMWDRFSDLPEHIIHHIFSFLGMFDIIRISSVSRRWREMCIRSPYLKFTLTCPFDYPRNVCKQFSDHVDRQLSPRNGLEICCLCLHWTCPSGKCDVNVNLIDKWVNVAISCKVQEIDLGFGIFERPHSVFFQELPIYELPKCIFSSKTLRVLKLDMHYRRLKEPTAAFLSLEDLTLTEMAGTDPEDALKKLISTACPSLKRLTIEDLTDVKTLSVISPSLEELTLFGLPHDLLDIEISSHSLLKLDLYWHSLFAGELCAIKIDAPNLQDLKWNVYTPNAIYLSQFRFLKNAEISVVISNSYVHEAASRNLITNLLQRVCCTRTLQVSINVLESQWLHNRMSFGFDYLQHLVITVDGCLKDYHLPVLASFIMQLPKLETLSLRCTKSMLEPVYYGELKMKASEVCKQHEGFHNLIGQQLKEIVVELKGEGHEVGCVENICKVAKGLKKLTIFYSKENYQSLLEIGLNSKTASLPFEVNLLEKEFYRRIH